MLKLENKFVRLFLRTASFHRGFYIKKDYLIFCHGKYDIYPHKVKLLHVDYRYQIGHMTLENILNQLRAITEQLAKRLVRLARILIRVDKNLIMRSFPVAIMLLLPIVILGPLLGRGYVLHYDMVFAPHVHLNIESLREGYGLYQSLPLDALLKLFSLVVPMDIVQKLILFTIFFLSAYSMYRSLPITSTAARLFAGLFYTINPFTYDRLMAGHWKFLLAYSITPLVMRAFFNFFTRPRRKHLLQAVLLWTLAVIINAHQLIILGLLFICFAAVFVRSARRLWYALGAIAGVLLLNLWWIIPALISPNQAGSFGVEHFYAFAIKADLTHGIWFTMLSLQGFWFTNWQSIKDIYHFWPLLTLVWLLPVFMGLGIIRGYQSSHKKLVISLLIASIIGLILAAGPHPPVSVLNGWLFTHIPGLSGMRESQKFLALLALAYAVLVAYGFDWLIRRKHKRIVATLALASFISIVLVARPMWWSGSGQLTRVHYPAPWHQFRDQLRSDKNSKAVVLPWQLYTNETFANTLVANPAKAFYGDQVVQSQKMNIPGVMDLESSQYRSIGMAVDKKDLALLKQAMKEIGANYIMITERPQSSRYNWLSDSVIMINNWDLVVIKVDK